MRARLWTQQKSTCLLQGSIQEAIALLLNAKEILSFTRVDRLDTRIPFVPANRPRTFQTMPLDAKEKC